MGLGSFLPRRNGSRAPLHPEVPKSADHGSAAPTEVSPDWSAVLHRHLQAQDQQAHPKINPPNQVSAPNFNRSTAQSAPTDATAATQVFPKIERPDPNHFPPYQPTIPQPKPYQQVPKAQALPNPTDINANIAYAESLKPPIVKRVLRYVMENGGIGVAVAFDIHQITDYGVWITDRGMSPQMRKLIPWSQIRSLEMDERDELYRK